MFLGPRAEERKSEFYRENLAYSKRTSKLEGREFFEEIEKSEKFILNITSNLTQSRKILLPSKGFLVHQIE